MNKYDELFEFRLANVDEIEKIMDFNRKYWGRPNHILANNRKFFEYEFRKDNRVGYFLAIEKKTNTIGAAAGVYFYSGNHIPGKTDMSSGMFLASPDCKVPFIGSELMKRMLLQLNPRCFVGPGTNMKTSGTMYKKLLHYEVERMRHFYILADKTEYKVAKIENKKNGEISENLQFELNEIKSIEDLYKKFDENLYKIQKPYKDRWYINHRYFEHPKYIYRFFLCKNSTVLVGREITVQNTKIFRIVDILGDVSKIKNLGNAFKKLLITNNYEYIDLYENRVNDTLLFSAGFVEREEDDCNVIPNYFEPYECKNVEIYTQFLTDDKYSMCFKGDGDQDRPNFL